MEVKSDNFWTEVWLVIISIFTGLVAYFGSLSISDRDERMSKLEEWKKEHEKDHVSQRELDRMHNENREWMQGLSDQQEKNRDASEKNFKYLSSRMDTLLSRDHKSRDSDK